MGLFPLQQNVIALGSIWQLPLLSIADLLTNMQWLCGFLHIDDINMNILLSKREASSFDLTSINLIAYLFSTALFYDFIRTLWQIIKIYTEIVLLIQCILLHTGIIAKRKAIGAICHWKYKLSLIIFNIFRNDDISAAIVFLVDDNNAFVLAAHAQLSETVKPSLYIIADAIAEIILLNDAILATTYII